jgi:hypothetical protein
LRSRSKKDAPNCTSRILKFSSFVKRRKAGAVRQFEFFEDRHDMFEFAPLVGRQTIQAGLHDGSRRKSRAIARAGGDAVKDASSATAI